jgi:hypothetical protein
VSRLKLDGASALHAGVRASLRFSALHFPSSEFGIVHADRTANDAYSQWSAETATQIIALIAGGRPVRELFDAAGAARRVFARDFEKVPEADIEGAAVGRIVFGAVASHLAGKPVTLPPEVDVQAIISTLPQFVRWLGAPDR